MRTLSTVLVLALLLGAGCLGKEDPAPADDAAQQAAAKGNQTAGIVDDGTSKAAIVDTGSKAHMHDYWKGKERVTLFEGDLQPDMENATFATIFVSVFGKGVYAGGMLWQLPDGQIVYEGAGKMVLTASWSDPRVTGLAFEYRSAESPDYKPGGALENGKAFDLPLTPKMTDMPHSKSSRWGFGFAADQSPGAVLGPFHLKVEIVKLADIELFPAHPDFWQGNHSIQLLETTHHGEVPSYVLRATQPATQGNFTEDLVNLARPVPMETQAIRFNVTITSAESTPGTVTSFGFFYHGADTQNPFRCAIKPTPSFPATLTWTVPATMDQSDSPYETGSRWQFLVEPQATIADGAPEAGGMTDVKYDYKVTVTGFDAPAEKLDKCAVDEQG